MTGGFQGTISMLVFDSPLSLLIVLMTDFETLLAYTLKLDTPTINCSNSKYQETNTWDEVKDRMHLYLLFIFLPIKL